MATVTPVMVRPIELRVPPQTQIHIRAYTNAAFKQRITLQLLPNTPPMVFEGNGEQDHLIGEKVMMTPPAPTPIPVKVMIENNGGGTFHPSKLMKIGCELQTYNMVGVISEDAGDEDYNDAVLEITWWTRL